MDTQIVTYLYNRVLLNNGKEQFIDTYYSHENKTHVLLGRKVVTSLDSILKSRDVTLLTKVHLVKAMVFPVSLFYSFCLSACPFVNTTLSYYYNIILRLVKRCLLLGRN